MREMGIGDVGVNKKMKILNKIFYDILLKINLKKGSNFELNKDIVKVRLFNGVEINDALLVKISDYFEHFYKFCFVLDDNSMLKGLINYKF